MERRRDALALILGLLAAIAAGCDSGPSVAPRIVHAPGADPYLGASALALTVLRNDEAIVVEQFPPDARALSFGPIPFGQDGDRFVIRVEALASAGAAATPFVLSSGRSFPFVVRASGSQEGNADVYVGRLGAFEVPIAAVPSSAVRLVAKDAGGALIATDDGTIYRWTQHSAPDALPALEPAATIVEAAGARWVALGTGDLLAVGPGGVHFVREGAIVSAVGREAISTQLAGAALVAIDETHALLVGGAPDGASAPVAAITRIDIGSGGVLSLASLAPLDVPARDITVERVAVKESDTRVVRAVVVGGIDATGVASRRVALIDPDTGRTTARYDLAAPRQDATVIQPLDTGAIVIAGGSDAAGAPTADVTELVLTAAGLSVVSPSPGTLFTARSGAAAVRFGEEGAVLLVGGRGVDGSALSSAEILDLALLPGEIALTGSLGAGALAPRAALLDDRSVLVADVTGTWLYIPPRR